MSVALALVSALALVPLALAIMLVTLALVSVALAPMPVQAFRQRPGRLSPTGINLFSNVVSSIQINKIQHYFERDKCLGYPTCINIISLRILDLNCFELVNILSIIYY